MNYSPIRATVSFSFDDGLRYTYCRSQLVALHILHWILLHALWNRTRSTTAAALNQGGILSITSLLFVVLFLTRKRMVSVFAEQNAAWHKLLTLLSGEMVCLNVSWNHTFEENIRCHTFIGTNMSAFSHIFLTCNIYKRDHRAFTNEKFVTLDPRSRYIVITQPCRNTAQLPVSVRCAHCRWQLGTSGFSWQSRWSV